ncbi:response regulator receiver protein [Streptomyces sp. AS58]|uniref:ANTAR domain-containing protein n=1 Tax=Streptomyces cadmiisoli TaxID=2184053 RepID=A0A2Z4J2D2_9ACTN|nr:MULTISPECIES: GAF and ANTAR domain-containing protein [Streptomyces]AWW39401.1 ANTAR domain-containing protein [Streptomyces cadmiisoli]KOV51788.1 response regulator receiver protein [Streptomyces sp. AS58]
MHRTPRELRLAAALVEASDTLADDFDTGRQLRRLADHCVELLAARAAGVMVIDDGRAVTLTGSGPEQEPALDLLRAQADGGPCWDCYASGQALAPVSVGAAHAAGRWPEFTERALRHGVGSAFAVPLRGHGRTLGALAVFRSGPAGHPRPDAVPDVRVAQVLADGTALGLGNHDRYARCRTRAGQLQEALSSRVRIEQAKGMLAERWNTDVDAAFAALRQYARRHRLPLDRVARAVVERAVDL